MLPPWPPLPSQMAPSQPPTAISLLRRAAALTISSQRHSSRAYRAPAAARSAHSDFRAKIT